MTDWLLFDAIGLAIALAGLARVWWERWSERVEKRAKHVLRDYA